MRTIQSSVNRYDAPVAASSPPPQTAATDWSFVRGFALCAAVIYFLSYITWDDGGMLGAALAGPLQKLRPIIAWPLSRVFEPLTNAMMSHFAIDDVDGDIFDGPYVWMYSASMLLVALVASIVLNVLRARVNRHGIYDWGRAIIRYAVAMTMMSYGVMKIFQIQFGVQPLQHLMTPVGEMAPATLMWTFMESSYLYRVFTGSAEILAAVLLVFRRTTSLGALVTVAVMSNVVVMDVAYDIPVKQLSMHLAAMGVFLLLPDAQRLVDAFVRNRATTPRPLPSLPGTRRFPVAAKTAALAYAFGSFAMIAYGTWRLWDTNQNRPDASLTGIYEVESFTLNGQLRTEARDTLRWDRVAIEPSGFLTARRPGEHLSNYLTRFAPTRSQLIAVTPDGKLDPRFNYQNYQKKMLSDAMDAVPTNSPRRFALAVAHPDSVRVRLLGRLGGDSIDVVMKRLEPSTLLLQRWGSHLVYRQTFSDTWIAAPYRGWPLESGR